MKKGLLASTALVGAAVMASGAATAAEAPEWKLGGDMNFQFYYVDQDWNLMNDFSSWGGATYFIAPEEDISDATVIQDHGWYFGVDEAELALRVDGTADNGLKYGFKIELQVDTTDTKVADEARIQLSGSWGYIQLGDEDGAEDIMNWGGESLMGGAGAFHYGDVRADTRTKHRIKMQDDDGDVNNGYEYLFPKGMIIGAPDNAEIAGDTSDHTKLSYFSPRFSGFQVGASITPQPGLDGDDFKQDGNYENHYGLGANYVNDFGDLRIRASAVYSAASRVNPDFNNQNSDGGDWEYADYSAWSVGGVIGWGPFDIGANYTDNGDSGQPKVYDDINNVWLDGNESWYYDVAASFKTGPFKFAVGYFASTLEWGGAQNLEMVDGPGGGDAEFTQISLTADYKAAPGLGFYAELTLSEDDPGLEDAALQSGVPDTNETTAVVVGAKVSF